VNWACSFEELVFKCKCLERETDFLGGRSIDSGLLKVTPEYLSSFGILSGRGPSGNAEKETFKLSRDETEYS